MTSAFSAAESDEEAVDGDHDRHKPEFSDIFDMADKIRHARFQRGEIFFLQILLLHAAMHLQGTDGRHEHSAGRLDPRLAALDVDEFLTAEIGAKSRFRDHIIRELERGGGGQHGVAAMRDVREWSAVNEGGSALQRLHQIGRDRILQQRGHGAVRLQIARAHRFAVASVADDDIGQAILQIVEILARQKIAITSEATVMSNPSSRGKPLATPPSEFMIWRSARSFMSMTRRQTMRR